MKKSFMRVWVFLCIAAFVLSGMPGSANAAVSPWGKPGTSFSYVTAYGAVDEPYTVDTTMLNRPQGLFLDDQGMLFVSEERGARIVRKDPSFLPIGTTGAKYTDENTFVNPVDMAKDANGYLWVADYSRVVEYNVSGAKAVFMQTIPATESWVTGNDTNHFNNVRGIAFDHAAPPNQHMFVTDQGNQRVQVYGISAEGLPYYINTIGGPNLAPNLVEPGRLAVTASNQLLIVDTSGRSIVRCSSINNWASWNCAPFAMTSGGTAIQLGYPRGIDVDANGSIVILDFEPARVFRCSESGACTVQLADVPYWALDVAGMPNSDILVTDWTQNVIRRYNAAGVEQPIYMGVLDTPYTTTPGHFYTPRGVTVAPDGSIYLLEELGYRLVKLDASGNQLWALGTPGVAGDLDTMLGDYWAGMEGNPAVDSAGRVYVPDTGNNRVQILNPDGSFYNRIGVTREWGNDETHVSCPGGVAISPLTGDIAVVDHCNQRIQVFAADTLAYKATIGTTSVSGSDNTHFRDPWGVAVDAKGAVYVADGENFRVQKCTYGTGNNFSCATFAGIPGEGGSDYLHMHPVSVAVDGSGRVYAADDYNSRVQVFDANGGYIATINGDWGPDVSQFRNVMGVAVDRAGKVYVTDNTNHRVQIFALGGSGHWRQANLNGFTNPANYGTWSLGWFNNQLYAGTANSGDGAEIWRQASTGDWEPVATGGFGNANNRGIDYLLAFKNRLYASTYNNKPDGSSEGGEIWRSDTGSSGSWTRVVVGGSGTAVADPANSEFYRMFLFNNALCATTWTDGSHGSEIWCSLSGDAGTWVRVAQNGLVDNANNIGIMAVQPYNGALYAGTYNYMDGANVLRSTDGVTWTPLFTPDGWGDKGNVGVTAIEVYNGALYALFAHVRGNGITLARCVTCDGSDWEELSQPANGFGDPNNRIMPGLEVHKGSLYLAAGNNATGLSLWKTDDGDHWAQAAPAGFGTPQIPFTYWDNAFLSAGGSLYLGTYTRIGTAQVWQLGSPAFLPLVGK